MLDWLMRRRREDDLQDEIGVHLSMAVQDRVGEGVDANEARLAALKEFGNVTLTRDAARSTWGGGWRVWLFDLAHDVRYSIRVLLRSPGYALIVTLVLALGIGANVSVFSIFRPLALEPVAGVSGSGRLGVVAARTTAGRILPLSYLDFRDLVLEQKSFPTLAGTSLEALNIGLGASGERVWAEMVTGNYFEVLGVRAQLGRTLLPSDDVAPGRHPVAVISDGLWKRAFGGDPGVVGRTVLMGGYPMTVVGVADPTFHGSIVSMDVEAFVPVMMQPQLQGRDDLSARLAPKLWGLGYLRNGVSIGEADSEAQAISGRLADLRPPDSIEQRAIAIRIQQSPFGAQTYLLPAVGLMGVMGVLLLLIVCANVSNLVLVRGMSRRGEIAARLALGASRVRVLRLLFIDSLVLAVPGAIAGLLASRALRELMNQTNLQGAAPGRQYFDVSIDGSVIAFALLLSCGSALIFGLLPSLHLSRVDLSSIMRDDLSPRAGSKSRMRSVLVVSQVAVSLMLLAGAGLVVRSLDSARKANPGFDARNTASLLLDLQPGGYDQARGHSFFTNLLDALRAEPGVEAVTLAAQTPMALVPGRGRDVEIEGHVPRPNEDSTYLINVVAPDYFQALRIRLLAGRDFDRTDTASNRKVAIVNETLARRFWGTPVEALGKRLRFVRGEWAIVTGVVSDIKYLRLDEDPRPFVYLPFEQYALVPMFVHVRGRDAIPTLIERSRARVQAMDANLPIMDARPLSERTQAGLGILAMAAGVLAVIGAIAAILAALGTYGMVSYSAKQREHEIGIRMAVGANRADVIRPFLGRGLKLGIIGAVIGLAASLAVSRGLASLLYGVSATDLVSFASASMAVMAVVCAASLVPAWKASRTDPIAALRSR